MKTPPVSGRVLCPPRLLIAEWYTAFNDYRSGYSET